MQILDMNYAMSNLVNDSDGEHWLDPAVYMDDCIRLI